MPHKDMPIFTRTFDLIAWLLPMTNHFPRAHRHSLTQRLLDAAFDLRERPEGRTCDGAISAARASTAPTKRWHGCGCTC